MRIQRKVLRRSVWVSTVIYLATIAHAGRIFASYASEPSGLQYMIPPFILAPIVLAAALIMWNQTAGLQWSRWFAAIPFIALILLILPATGIELSDTYLRSSALMMAVCGVVHIVGIAVYSLRRT